MTYSGVVVPACAGATSSRTMSSPSRRLAECLGRVLINKHADVGFRGRSGNLLLVLSLTGFDPNPT
jgi:hypothetical protein